MVHPPCSVLELTDRLCRTPSYIRPGGAEAEIAAFISDNLRQHHWLTVWCEEVSPGRPNVLAADCPPEDIALLIAGHIDTVPPTQGWIREEFTVADGRYHALGAADAKAAIAAALDAVGRAGPTRGVGYLLYVDEETTFTGMQHFIAHHPEIRASHCLSLCGASARVMSGCRSLMEIEFALNGHGGHASRPWEGRSATVALNQVLGELLEWCAAHDEPAPTTCNIAAIQAGSRAPDWTPGPGVPRLLAPPNRIPAAAWALVAIRSSHPEVCVETVRWVLADAVERSNTGQPFPITLDDFAVHLDMPGFRSSPELLPLLTEPFAAVHEGRHAPAGETGYLDLALLSARDGSTCLCMGPLKGGAHAPDEWVDIASLRRYRDGVVDLLSGFRR